MAQYRYRALRPDGLVVEDSLESENEVTARSKLEERGWLIFSVAAPKSGVDLGATVRKHRRPSLREALIFNQQFLALVKAGVPVLKTFDLLADRALNPGFRAALRGVREEIRGGASVSEAMARYPVYFPDLYRASLRSSEQTGNLVEVLQRYITYLKLIIGVREKVAKALAYPVFMIVVGIAVVSFLLMYVMPTFAEVYGQGRTELPGPTKMLLDAVASFQAWLPWIVAGTAAVGGMGYYGARTPAGRDWLSALSLRLPLLGEILLKNQIIRLTRTLATLLAGGIPLTTALSITSQAMTNPVVSRSLTRVTDRVKEGAGLAASLKQEQLIPPMMLEMIEVGETTGAIEAMLQEVAEFCEGELDLRLTQLTTWIEPVLLVVMGFLVGGIVIIMYLPVFKIAGAV
jgi:type IV pilus assembly protein PilC